jgi:signal transduction histidine kinase
MAGCIVAVWYSFSIAVDDDLDQEYRQELRALQVSDTSLSSDLLESRAGLVTHYDDLVRRIASLRAQSDSLAAPPSYVSAAGREAISKAVSDYQEILTQQEDLIETFKFDHAVLRNSLRFFPGEALALAKRVSVHPEGQSLAMMLNTLYSDVLLYYLFSESELVPSLRAEIAALRQSSPAWLAEADKKSINLLAGHATVIIERKPRVDQTIAGMLSLPSEARVREISQAYSRHHASVANAANRAELWAWMLALAFILAVSAYIILRLRSSAQALARATTKLEDALTSLSIEKEKHKELADLKSRFVSMTSHEFRTPLSVVLSSAELLQVYGERWPEEKKQTHLVRVQDAAKYMKQMLDEVLLIGRAEAGKLESVPGPVDIARFCGDLAETLRLHFESDHEVKYTTHGELSNLVIDQQLLMHILDNLLSNAFKYSPEQGCIRFDVAREDDELVFTVTDEGIGISKGDQERLFETFHRGANVGDVSGTGLGLAVVKKSLDVLEGTISVESELGEGSTFTVRIPAPVASGEELRDSA